MGVGGEALTRQDGELAIGRAEASTRRLEELYEEFSRATFGFFARRVGDPALAADLNQELYLRLSRTLDGFAERSSLRTWVFAAARNVLIDARRRRWRKVAEREVELDADAAEDLRAGSADDAAAQALLVERLRGCLRLLNDAQRAVVIGHYFGGVTLRELTENLSFGNKSGARAVLLAAQRALRRCIEEGNGGGDATNRQAG